MPTISSNNCPDIHVNNTTCSAKTPSRKCSGRNKRCLGLFVLIQLLILVKATSHLKSTGTAKTEMDDNHLDHMAMNHSGHHMTTTMDPHAGHDMGGMDHGGMDHSGMDHGTDHSGHGGSHHGSSVAGHGDMKMYFHISYEATILFERWTVDSWQGMLWSCIVIFIMGALYEGLKVLREHLLQKYNHTTIYEVNGKQPLATSEEVEVSRSHSAGVGARMCSISHLIQTVLHVIQIVLSYFLMLIFMTYNFYLCLAVAVGAGTGYFFFSWKRASIIDINEHCH